MTKNEKIQKIKQVIEQRRDEDLQALYRRAARSSVSPITIMRLWYGLASLSKQPKEMIDFLVRALDENDGCPKHESQDGIDETGVTVVDLNDPWTLRELLEMNAEEDELQIAPVLAVLAWIGFDEREALGIRCEEVDLLRRTICGRKIPDALYRVIVEHYEVEEYDVESHDSRGLSQRFVRARGRAGRGSGAMLKSVMEQYGISYQDIRMSGENYRLNHQA